MKSCLLLSSLLLVAFNAFALQPQSLLSTTLTEDTSPQQTLNDTYSVPQVNKTTRQQVLFDGYKVPDASHVNFAIPAGLYRQLCTSCLYDTQKVECNCQIADSDKWQHSVIAIKDCQQITVSTNGDLMCLPSPKKS